MAMQVRGFSELATDLEAMSTSIDSPAVTNKALRAGADPIKTQMLANASSDPKIITGALHGSIDVGAIKRKSITVGVHHSAKGAYYANPVEFGHGGPAPAPAHPFVRPAFDAKQDEAYSRMAEVLEAQLK